MIVDCLSLFRRYLSICPKFSQVYDFIQQCNLSTLPLGRHEIDGSNLFVNIDTYVTCSQKKIEAHRHYIDIQILLEGEEEIGWCPLKDIKTTEAYDLEKDIFFGVGETQKIFANPSLFFIFFPEDAHQPCLMHKQPSRVKKAIFKVQQQ